LNKKIRDKRLDKEYMERYIYKVIDKNGDEICVDKYGYNDDEHYVGEVSEYDKEDEEDIKKYKEEYKYDEIICEPLNEYGRNIFNDYKLYPGCYE